MTTREEAPPWRGSVAAPSVAEDELTAARARTAELAETNAGLQQSVERLTRALESAVADERKRQARDIHDTLAQALALIVMQLADAQNKLGPAWALAHEPLETARQLAMDSLAAARRTVSMLRPATATGLSLPRALRDVADLVRRYCLGQLEVRVTGTPWVVEPAAEGELLGIAREALTNAANHSRATRVEVELAFLENGTVRIVVADNGRGFDPDRSYPNHYGLVGMHERADRIGAALTVVTEPGAGTEIVAVWPT
jgi:signal transduction histidine kinase